MNPSILQDILPASLTDAQKRIISSNQYSNIIQAARSIDKSRSPAPSKTINEFYGLVKDVIDDYEKLAKVTDDAKLFFTEEEPDFLKNNQVTITVSLVDRQPSLLSSQHNVETKRIRGLIPQLREEVPDLENPGYKRAILGYYTDNIIKFTIWARTNKVANDKALWFEGLMQEYRWYFGMQGVQEVIFTKREADTFEKLNDQKLYARPLIYLVKTESLTTISQKTIEQITIGTAVNPLFTLLQT